jgi:hypothetical protein
VVESNQSYGYHSALKRAVTKSPDHYALDRCPLKFQAARAVHAKTADSRAGGSPLAENTPAYL